MNREIIVSMGFDVYERENGNIDVCYNGFYIGQLESFIQHPDSLILSLSEQ